MPTPFTHFGELPIEIFLREYWQKKPLLIRNAFPEFESPISADELAGFALEEELESRLIQSAGWQLQHGPFTENDFANLPADNWSLLVQSVDQLVPDIAELLEYFRFLPSWRLDDIMVSYATDQGSVGPHFDHYDVFLMQAEGDRLWQVGQWCDENSELLTDTDLCILKHFNKTEEWLLKPGDMLYLPPKLAHWGIAQGSCMTYSIGFRAPATSDILSHYCDHVLSELSHDPRYSDLPLKPENTFEIPAAALDKVRAMLLDAIDRPEQLARWFGSYMTQPRYPLEPENSGDLEKNSLLIRAPDARLAYVRQGDDRALLSANGETHEVSLGFALAVCGGQLRAADWGEELAILASLASHGVLIEA